MELQTILNAMSHFRLTADETLVIHTTLLAREEFGGHKEFFDQWYKECDGKNVLKIIVEHLKMKGVLLAGYEPTAWIPEEVEFNKIFLKGWFKYTNIMGMEVFNTYIPFLLIKDTYYPARDISKKWNTLDEFCFYYGNQISWDPKKHKEVMDILKWSIDNNYLNMGITNFVVSHQWEALKQLRDNPKIVPTVDSVMLYE